MKLGLEFFFHQCISTELLKVQRNLSEGKQKERKNRVEVEVVGW